jgi:hypothetical protein
MAPAPRILEEPHDCLPIGILAHRHRVCFLQDVDPLRELGSLWPRGGLELTLLLAPRFDESSGTVVDR